MTYIPDMTERFPEGMNGVDMIPSFFGEPVDYSRAMGYETNHNELVESSESEEHKCFSDGQTYRVVGIYGGVTTFKVKEIDRENERILLEEFWEDVDGSGTRPEQWHKLERDFSGNEKALNYTSKEYGNFWIYAD